MDTFETNTHRFVVAIDNKDTKDMKYVMNEYISMGYSKINEMEYKGNVILIYAKEK